MVGRHDEPQRFGGQGAHLDAVVVPEQRRQLEVDADSGAHVERVLVGLGAQVELHARVLAPEAAHEVGHEPGAEVGLEGHGDDASLGVEQLLDSGQAVVEVVHHRVDMALERGARPGQAQHAPRALQQRRADLPLESGQRPGDPRLRHHLEVADLGEGHAVGDLLEPAQHLCLHDP